MPVCECCSCCVVDGVPTLGVAEADCFSYCQFTDYTSTGGTQVDCEAKYDGCEFTGGTYDGNRTALNETDCVAGGGGPAYCSVYLPTDDPADCPDGWVWVRGNPSVPGSNACYYESCIGGCGGCDTDVPGAQVSNCGGDDDSPDAHCNGESTLTPRYGVWHSRVWYVHCGDYVAPSMLAVGPGWELKKLLGTFGIHATPNCKCNKMAKKMDAWGPDECLNHIEEIVDVMEEEAGKRKLPFLRSLGRLLVKKAIRRARGQ